jgi:hypothetical protein
MKTASEILDKVIKWCSKKTPQENIKLLDTYKIHEIYEIKDIAEKSKK